MQREQVVRRTAWLLAHVVAVALVGVVVLRLAGAERGTLAILATGALPLTLLPSYALVLLGLLGRRLALAGLSAVVVAAHLALVAPALGAAPVPDGAAEAARLRVVGANLYFQNPDPEQAGRALRAMRPDVLVVPELTLEGLAGLRASGLLDDLPYTEVQLGERGETVGLLSRLPLRDVAEARAGGRVLPRATVSVGGVDVRLLAAHPLPPIGPYEGVWRRSIGALVEEVRAEPLALVLWGDLNADRDHAPFRELLDAGLRDAHDERGRGLAATWPSSLPLLHLDHVLVRDSQRISGGQVVVLDVREAEVPGSDHKAVVADLAVLPGR